METWLEVCKQQVMINRAEEGVTAALVLLLSCPLIGHAGRCGAREMQALPHTALSALLAAPH